MWWARTKFVSTIITTGKHQPISALILSLVIQKTHFLYLRTFSRISNMFRSNQRNESHLTANSDPLCTGNWFLVFWRLLIPHSSYLISLPVHRFWATTSLLYAKWGPVYAVIFEMKSNLLERVFREVFRRNRSSHWLHVGGNWFPLFT